MMSLDADRVEVAFTYCHYLWSGPGVILSIICVLFYLIGWYAAIGLSLLVLFAPLQRLIIKRLSGYRQEAIKHADERVKKMQEMFAGIRVIKFYCWEEALLDNLMNIRGNELKYVQKIQFLRACTLVFTTIIPIFCCIATFLVYMYFGNELKPDLALSCILLFARLRMPLFWVPLTAAAVTDGWVSLKRIEQFLCAEESDRVTDVKEKGVTGEYAIVVEGGFFEWKKRKLPNFFDTNNNTVTSFNENSLTQSMTSPMTQFCGFNNLNLKIPRGKLVAIVGAVGSGKSSLIHALLGEMEMTAGRMSHSGALAYSSQQAWIQNTTIRENVLFGRPFRPKLYQAAIAAAALERDLQGFPDGDLTEVGERGSNLSGGQKQRVNLARLAYSTIDSDIFLVDDPLSAVDSHVARHLFDKLFKGHLAGKTRILVTHQLHFLPSCDLIVFLKEGEGVRTGTFSELMKGCKEFNRLVVSESANAENSVDNVVSSGNVVNLDTSVNVKCIDPMDANFPSIPSSPVPEAALIEESCQDPCDPSNRKSKLISKEDRMYGAVKLSVFLEYLNFAGGAPIVATVLFGLVMVESSRLASDYFPSRYVNLPMNKFATIYLGLGVWSVAAGIFFALVLSRAGVRASRRLFRQAVMGVLQAPIAFFDANPIGRIVNRFSKDQDAVDNLLLDAIRSVLTTFGSIFSTIVLIICNSPYFILALIPFGYLYYHFQLMYRTSSRELKRLDTLSKSPLYAQFAETLSGITTIRSYHQQAAFTAKNASLLDFNNRAVFHQFSAERWIAVRLEGFGTLLTLVSGFFAVIMGVEPVMVGLVMGNALDITFSLHWMTRQLADLEAHVVCAERLSHYANHLPIEGATKNVNNALISVNGTVNSKDNGDSWPDRGEIVFDDVSLSYRPDLPLVLHNLSITIAPGERIGIVGRTGAGKSTLLMALFRIVELANGRILVDGVDLSELPLKEARLPLSIIPQDPVLFSGTIRSNLDPFLKHSDADLWDCLDRAYLKSTVQLMDDKLDAEVAEGGENLSVGIRQLLCLARALLRRNRILVLDEATANIDLETDSLVQHCIRKNFANCTMLTIAHRLNTVIDYDKILVMEAGRMVEFESPERLLEDTDSVFYGLCAETGDANLKHLKQCAKKARRL